MRSVYLLVGSFAVWCLLAAFWYLFWIKGLDPKPENINPHESALAIAEILAIVLVSLFIGFGAESIMQVSQKISTDLINPAPYIQAVLGIQPTQP